MSFPKYELPSVAGISFLAGSSGTPQPLQEGDGRLCALADAMLIAKVFQDAGYPATLANAATDASLNQKFEGLDPASPYQPWVVTGIPNPGYAGWALKVQWGPNDVNGGGRGNPGSWSGVGSGNPHYNPAPVPALPTTPSPPYDPANDVNWATIQGATAGATEQNEVAEILRILKHVYPTV